MMVNQGYEVTTSGYLDGKSVLGGATHYPLHRCGNNDIHDNNDYDESGIRSHDQRILGRPRDATLQWGVATHYITAPHTPSTTPL